MVDFRTTRRVETRNSSIKVDAGLPEGNYIFQLTAFDASGNKSKPTQLKVAIVRSPVITGPVGPGAIIPDDPIIRRPIRPALVTTTEALTSAVVSEPVRTTTSVTEKSVVDKTPSKTTSRIRSRRKKTI